MALGRGALARLLVSVNRTGLRVNDSAAKSAALNWVLLQNSFQTANNLLAQIQQQQQQQQGAAAAAGDKASQASSSPGQQQQQQSIEQLKRPSKLKLVRSYYRYFRKQQRTTSMWWWVANAAVQANTFVIMSVALRQMADSQWPGMADQGLFWFADLTQPSVLLTSLACPYGVAGTLLPVAMVALYLKTVQQSPAVRSAGMKLLLDCGSLPYFCMACLVPQATLLYWAGNSVFFYGMQSALAVPNVARRLGLPNMLLPTPRGPREERERAEQEAKDAHQLICGSEDDGFLRFLAANYMSRGRHQQALQCLQRLTVLAPGDSSAFSALGRTAAELQQWPTAAAAYGRSAELHAAVGEVEEQATELVLSGKHWLNAVAEVRQQQKAAAAAAKDKHGRSSSSSSSASSSKGSSSSSQGSGSSSTEGSSDGTDEPITWGVNVDKEQDYIEAALKVLHAAVSLPAEAAGEGRYLLAMAQAAGRQRNEALATSQQYWAAACDASHSDPAAKSNAAAKLLPVLANLCKQYHAQGEDESVMATAALAAEVAQAGWDRQSREQLYDTLGAAAQAAAAGGRFALAEQLKGLQGKLLGSSTGSSSSSSVKGA
ncbi:hypothetical protein OEZ85_012105 [Tetradesmus obliquus]|uniref:Uncharacterized protein n=1 Tax=Tetradesmus obliquus TaxID=3088 RepID=A0ABY8TSD9_TETOB|nr:hypothetical protein OEZ85_012105 [Tetradesmus obliquus]